MYQEVRHTHSLGSIRLSEEDAHAVIDLWVERQGVCDRPTVADVAEGLDITVEEVHALMDEVYRRRTRVEIAIVEERERLAMEQRELAAEQARLAGTERRLAQFHAERSGLREARLAARRQRLHLESWPPPGPMKSVTGTQRQGLPPAGRKERPRRRNAIDTIGAITVLLLVGGWGVTAVWNLVSPYFR